jgi:hypothetical protein
MLPTTVMDMAGLINRNLIGRAQIVTSRGAGSLPAGANLQANGLVAPAITSLLHVTPDLLGLMLGVAGLWFVAGWLGPKRILAAAAPGIRRAHGTCLRTARYCIVTISDIILSLLGAATRLPAMCGARMRLGC